ncbi:hypothetical protein ABIB90_006927 [Bradyrhizobium sp. JR4.1]
MYDAALASSPGEGRMYFATAAYSASGTRDCSDAALPIRPLNCHRPRRRAIQYFETSVMNREAAAYWIPRLRGA